MENHGDVFASVFAKIRIGSAIGSHIIYIYMVIVIFTGSPICWLS